MHHFNSVPFVFCKATNGIFQMADFVLQYPGLSAEAVVEERGGKIAWKDY